MAFAIAWQMLELKSKRNWSSLTASVTFTAVLPLDSILTALS